MHPDIALVASVIRCPARRETNRPLPIPWALYPRPSRARPQPSPRAPHRSTWAL